MTKKIILKCEPDWDCDIYFDMCLENDSVDFILCGNKDYQVKTNKQFLENVIDAYERFSGWASDVEDFMYYAGVEIAGNRTQFYKALTGSSRNDDNVCAVLRLITGKEWNCITLRGCCQGDWIDCFYCPETTSKDFIDYIEAVFFGTGYELGVIECADDIDIENVDESDVDYWGYTDKWRDDDICKWLGFDPADCILLEEHKSTVTVSRFY